MVKLPVASPLEKTVPFSNPTPFQKPSVAKSYTSGFLPQFLRVLFNAFLSRLGFFGVGWVGASQKPSVSLILNYESAIIDTTAKEAPWPFTVSSSTDHNLYVVSGDSVDHRHLHGLQGQHKPRTSAWSLTAVWTTDIHTALRCSMKHRHQHSPQRQHRPQT